MNRKAQIKALNSRAQCYEEAAACSWDSNISEGFRRSSQELRDHALRLDSDTEYELPKAVRRELGLPC